MGCSTCTATSLCFQCVDAAVKAAKRDVARLARTWGIRVYRRKPDGDWPRWNEDKTGRLQATAVRLVRDLHTDRRVLDRLARECAAQAGSAYDTARMGEETERRLRAERELRRDHLWRGGPIAIEHQHHKLEVMARDPDASAWSSKVYTLAQVRELARTLGVPVRVLNNWSYAVLHVFDQHGNPTTLEAINRMLDERAADATA